MVFVTFLILLVSCEGKAYGYKIRFAMQPGLALKNPPKKTHPKKPKKTHLKNPIKIGFFGFF
jgi:hypothetical protein